MESGVCPLKLQPELLSITPVLRQGKNLSRTVRQLQAECSFQGTPPPQEHSLSPHNQILALVKQRVDTAPPSLSSTFHHLHRSRCLRCLNSHFHRPDLALQNARPGGDLESRARSRHCLLPVFLLTCLEASLQEGFQMSWPSIFLVSPPFHRHRQTHTPKDIYFMQT